MSAPITAIQGRYGRFQVNNQYVNAMDWDAEIKTDIIVITGFEDQNAIDPTKASSGRTANVKTDGCDDCTATLNAYVDKIQLLGTIGNNLAPLGIQQGTVLSGVKLYMYKGDATALIQMPLAIVRSIKYTGQVKEAFKYTLQIENTGPFCGPGQISVTA